MRLAKLVAIATVLLLAAPVSFAYRAVYAGSYPDFTWGTIPSTSATDEQFLVNIVRWVSNKPAGVVRIGVLRSQGQPYYANFQAARPADVAIVNINVQPFTLADLVAANVDMLAIPNAWHGDPAIVPAPDPGGGDWSFTPGEIQAIRTFAYSGKGLYASAGSFGQYSINASARNYELASLFGLVSTGGGVPAQADAFPWSRAGSYYPNTRAVDTIVRDAMHPVMTTPFAMPASWTPSFPTAGSQWMGLAGATQVAHYRLGGVDQPDTLVTAFDNPAVERLDVVAAQRHEPVWRSKPTVYFVDAENTGSAQLDLSAASVALLGEAATFTQEVLDFRMEDSDSDGRLDVGGRATWAVVLVFPKGPPDRTFAVDVTVTYGASSSTAVLNDRFTTKSLMKGNEMGDYRSFDDAVRWLRAALRNGEPTLAAGVAALRPDTPEAWDEAKHLVVNTSPGPGSFDDLKDEVDSNGNGKYGLSN